MIAFAHLYNDRSGSPRVLSSVISDLARDQDCRLFIGSDGNGILDSFSNISEKYWYRRTGRKLATLCTFAMSQIALFLKLLGSLRTPREETVYVNTLLPFGAAIFGKLTGRRVIYHLHEVSLSPAILQQFLTLVARLCADHLIYVSKFHQERLPIAKVPFSVVHNAIDPSISSAAQGHIYTPRIDGLFRVLMLASGRAYKGIPEFIRLARDLEHRDDIRFMLILSSDEDNILGIEAAEGLPNNVELAEATINPEIYYRQANLVLNLSRVDLWQETFGLTILEAMEFGVPVIAPPVGGPTEILSNGKEGFLIDSRDTEALGNCVTQIADSPDLCMQLSSAAKTRSAQFDISRFHRAIRHIVNAEVNIFAEDNKTDD